MRAQILALVVFMILCSTITYAGTCTDTDGGPINIGSPTKFIGIFGSVDYGTGPKEDYCVSRLGGSFVSSGEWVREYFCDGDRIDSEDYECKDYNYASCVNGTCVNYTGTQAALDDIGAPAAENYSNCGNKKLDGKEECDPPGKVCMISGGGMGTCTNQCKCIKSVQNQTVSNETASQNQTIQLTINASNATGGNQSAAAKLTFETKAAGDAAVEKPVVESEESGKEKTEGYSTPTGAIPADIQEIIEETDAEIEELANSPMIKITSAITAAMMKVWSLFSGLFGG